MIKFLLIFLSWFLLSNYTSIAPGEFYGRNGRSYFRLTIKKDSTFEQVNTSCTWQYCAKGKWRVRLDTIILEGTKFYSINSRGKKKLQKNVKPYQNRYFNFYNQCIILGNDSLMQLVNSGSGTMHQLVKLRRISIR